MNIKIGSYSAVIRWGETFHEMLSGFLGQRYFFVRQAYLAKPKNHSTVESTQKALQLQGFFGYKYRIVYSCAAR